MYATDSDDLRVRGVSSDSSSKVFHIEIDGSDVTGPINFNTGGGGWQAWQDVIIDNNGLNSGAQELRIVMGSRSFNMNYLEVTRSE